MLIQSKTLKLTLADLISRYGLVEVLDRLADLSHSSTNPNKNQITRLLEDAVEMALVQNDLLSQRHALTRISGISGISRTSIQEKP
jgi:hypothetical protein